MVLFTDSTAIEIVDDINQVLLVAVIVQTLHYGKFLNKLFMIMENQFMILRCEKVVKGVRLYR